MLLEFIGYFSFLNLLLLAIIYFFKSDSIASGTRILSLWLVTVAYTQLILTLFYTHDIEKVKYLAYSEAIVFYMSMPLFYFYILRLTNTKDLLSNMRWFHLVPMIPGLIYWGVHNSLSPEDQLISIRTAWCGPLRDEWLNIIGVGLQFFYIRLSYKAIQSLIHKAKLTLSNIDKVEIKWVKFMLTSFLVIGIIYISLCILIHEKRIIDLITILSFDLFFFLIFVKHLAHPPDYKYFSQLSFLAAETIHPDHTTSIKYKGFRMRDDEVSDLNLRLLSIMEDKKPYLNSELSLSGLADMVNTTPHRLSFVINTTMEMNYFDFINSYRVKEAMNLLQTAQEIDSKIIAIAFDSGFNNRTSFHLAFKKVTGLTPKEYREKQSKVEV